MTRGVVLSAESNSPESTMGRIDLFESVFKAATRDVFEHQPVPVKKVLLVTDTTAEVAARVQARIDSWLTHLEITQWEVLTGMEAADVGNLIDAVERAQPDLVCTWRNLHSNAWKWPYTIGDHAEVLTQVSHAPVLLVPRPEKPWIDAESLPTTVMALTDHLSGDHRLVNYAAAFTPEGARLWLTHVEDDAIFARYVEAFSKIPTIDTATAEESLRTRLLKDPTEFIESCQRVLKEDASCIDVQPLVSMGHLIASTRKLVEDHAVDLLVMNTKDDDQVAMHGLAYPLAVELREIPTLML